MNEYIRVKFLEQCLAPNSKIITIFIHVRHNLEQCCKMFFITVVLLLLLEILGSDHLEK